MYFWGGPKDPITCYDFFRYSCYLDRCDSKTRLHSAFCDNYPRIITIIVLRTNSCTRQNNNRKKNGPYKWVLTIVKKYKYKKVGVLPIRTVKSNVFLSDKGPMLETLAFTIRIGSTPTFLLYFDSYLDIACLSTLHLIAKKSNCMIMQVATQLSRKFQSISNKQIGEIYNLPFEELCSSPFFTMVLKSVLSSPFVSGRLRFPN